jgi:hypothetical protein
VQVNCTGVFTVPRTADGEVGSMPPKAMAPVLPPTKEQPPRIVIV